MHTQRLNTAAAVAALAWSFALVTQATAFGQAGTTGPTFKPGLSTNGSGRCMAVQPGGKIVIGGSSGTVGGVPSPRHRSAQS